MNDEHTRNRYPLRYIDQGPYDAIIMHAFELGQDREEHKIGKANIGSQRGVPGKPPLSPVMSMCRVFAIIIRAATTLYALGLVLVMIVDDKFRTTIYIYQR
jgi:hypothetical protein